MTLTINLTPEAAERLQQKAALHGQEPKDYAWAVLAGNLGLTEETEAAVFADMRALSQSTLREYWLNDEDAVYDAL